MHRLFGSKEGLFVAAMELPVAPGELVAGLLAGGVHGLGERIVRALLAIYDTPDALPPFLALVRAATSNERAAAMLREFLTTEVLGPLAAAAAPDAPELRAALAGSQVIGMAMGRYVVRLGPLTQADHETLAAAVGPTLQRYLTGPLVAGSHGERHSRPRP